MISINLWINRKGEVNNKPTFRTNIIIALLIITLIILTIILMLIILILTIIILIILIQILIIIEISIS
jgi:hypothetical protein